MNLYLRLLLLFLRLPFTSINDKLLTPTRIRFTVLPSDADINFHLTNARYLSFMDLARIHLLAKMGLLKKTLDKKWLPVVHSNLVTYIRPIAPLARFDVKTELLYWDEKYFYIQQTFENKDKVYAIAMVRGLFLHGKNKVPVQDIIDLSGQNVPAPPMPDVVRRWVDTLEEKKQHSK